MNTSDISSLLDGSSTGTSASQAASSSLGGLGSFLMPLIIVSTILSILIMVMYGFSMFNKWRVNHAILEIRDILKEMQQQSHPPTAAPQIKSDVDAAMVSTEPQLQPTVE